MNRLFHNLNHQAS